MAKNFSVGIDIAKQTNKGGPRDADFKDQETPKGAATRSYETNPADGKGTDERGIEPVKL